MQNVMTPGLLATESWIGLFEHAARMRIFWHMSRQQTHCAAGGLDGLPALNELRLNHCRVSALPEGLAAAARLRILDLGHNPISRVEDLQVTHATLLCIFSVNEA